MLSTINLDVVAEATNGEESVELYRKEKPDVLLLDINMPVKNGVEALHERRVQRHAIRRNEENASGVYNP